MPTNSREKIIGAALDVFSQKGRYGARMEEIAERARINKAMVYYYFGSRDNLYRNVLRKVMKELFSAIAEIVGSLAGETIDPAEKIRKLSGSYYAVISSHRAYVKILLEALTGTSQEIVAVVRELKEKGEAPLPEKLIDVIQDGIRSRVFRAADPLHILNSLIGLNLSFFVTRPIFATLLDMDAEAQETFIREREQAVTDILLYGIVEKKELPQ